MNASEIGHYRLANQQITASRNKTPAGVVCALGAMQAQDYPGALWALALRLPQATEADVERAIAGRSIVRTWPMRGTLHFVAATDVHWMLELLTPRIIAGSKGRWQQLELDAKLFARSRKLFVRVLQGNRQLSREAMLELLERDGISMNGQRGYHILWRLAQEGTLCFGARSGKQHTFALLDEWVANPKKLERDAALGELARRYFTSHGPATLLDFAGWSGLKVSDARAGLDSMASQLICETIGGNAYWMSRDLPDLEKIPHQGHLLPGFDEFVLGYKDRSAVLDSKHAPKIIPGGNGMFMPTMVTNGRVTGTWKRALKKKEVVITLSSFSRLSKAEKEAVVVAAERYGKFLGLPVTVKSA